MANFFVDKLHHHVLGYNERNRVFNLTHSTPSETFNTNNERKKKQMAPYEEKRKRPEVNFNHLILTTTLPTIFSKYTKIKNCFAPLLYLFPTSVLTALLMACFFSLKVKGKCCTRIFKPRDHEFNNGGTNNLTNQKE